MSRGLRLQVGGDADMTFAVTDGVTDDQFETALGSSASSMTNLARS
jgi:hypothetical protein